MAPIEMLTQHSKAYIAPVGHDIQRGKQADDRVIGNGRLCYRIGGLKIQLLPSLVSRNTAKTDNISYLVPVFAFREWVKSQKPAA